MSKKNSSISIKSIFFLLLIFTMVLVIVYRDLALNWVAFWGALAIGLLVLVFSRVICSEEQKVHQTEEKLHERERLFSRFIDTAHLPIAIVHVNGSIELLNEKFQQLYGYTSEDIPTIDHWFRNAYPDEKLRKEIGRAWRRKLKDAMNKGVAVTFKERTVTCKDGSTRDVVFAYTLIDDRVIITFNDNTEQNKLRQTEQELRHRKTRARKMEAIGLMAGGVAHDLNNILSGIVSYPELLLMQLPEESDLRKPICAIQESGQRASAVVADLLTIARGVASVKETSSLNILVQEYLDSPENQKISLLHENITISTQLDPDLFNISCSPVHIKKCIMNLITNATEAIDVGGSIVISTRNQYMEEPADMYLQIKKGDYAVLCVKDTGAGIPEAHIGHIFEPFYTKKIMGKSGTGLGLSVVWNTVQDHAGGIKVESSDKGTTFELYFPVTKDAAPIKEERTAIEELKGDGEHVLVVDDEPLLREIASEMLATLGYQVDVVSSGEEAIEFLKEKSVSLVLLDMFMEPNMNGRETYEQIIQIHPGQKAVIASGYAKNSDVQKANQLGAKGFIKKPYSMEQLGKAVKEELGK